MKRYEIVSATGFDGLKLTERPTPRPGPRQIVVRVRAASLNYRDIMIVSGGYMRGLPFPIVPLSDGAGEIAEIGAEVTRLKAGDRVAGIFFQRWLAGPVKPDIQEAALGGTADGMLTEYALLDAEGVVRIPDHLSYAEAATLPCAALTAWHGLIEAGGLKAGDTVLLLGTGGVSVFGLQLARLAGAATVIISSSEEKLERARALGAGETINYRRNPDWQNRVGEVTGGRGVDHVLEVVGAATMARSLAALRVGGHVAIIGARAGQAGEIDRQLVLRKGLRITGINVGSRAMFEAMNRAITANRLHPAIHRTYPFTEAIAAYRDFAAASHFGKVVITLDG